MLGTEAGQQNRSDGADKQVNNKQATPSAAFSTELGRKVVTVFSYGKIKAFELKQYSGVFLVLCLNVQLHNMLQCAAR